VSRLPRSWLRQQSGKVVIFGLSVAPGPDPTQGTERSPIAGNLHRSGISQGGSGLGRSPRTIGSSQPIEKIEKDKIDKVENHKYSGEKSEERPRFELVWLFMSLYFNGLA
jgi:hypothetical protein